MKHIKNFSKIASKGALAAILATGLVSCSNQDFNESNNSIARGGATVFIEKTTNGYKIVDEFPSNETRIFVREKDADGKMNERLLTQAEIDKLLQEENVKIQSGTSALLDDKASISSGGMGIGEAILASAAGAILGSWIGSKLFNSPGYNASRQAAYSNPSTYSRSQNSFSKAASTTSNAKSGYFGGSKTASQSSTSSASS